MKWWQYAQNNSGGSFIGPAHLVFVEAESADKADEIAVEHGIYFDGCETGNDCRCCGDRWSTANRPYYQVDDKLYGDQSLLVIVDNISFMLRNADGTWVPEHEALTEQVRVEIAIQIETLNFTRG